MVRNPSDDLRRTVKAVASKMRERIVETDQQGNEFESEKDKSEAKPKSEVREFIKKFEAERELREAEFVFDGDRFPASELVLYINNDDDLHRQMKMPIWKNYTRKKKKDKFDRTLAIKGMLHLVDAGAKKYKRELGSEIPVKWNVMWPKDVRSLAAQELVREFVRDYDDKAFDFMEEIESDKPTLSEALVGMDFVGPYWADVTYSETTPESAAQGDTSDTGFDDEDIMFDDFDELVDFIDSGGFSQWSNSDPGPGDWISTDWYISDRRTGTERQESIHIRKSKNPRDRETLTQTEVDALTKQLRLS